MDKIRPLGKVHFIDTGINTLLERYPNNQEMFDKINEIISKTNEIIEMINRINY